MPVFKVYSDSDAGYIQVYQSNQQNSGAILSPHLKLGTNKAGGFDFTVLPENPAYDTFKEMKTYVYVLRDDEYVFRGRVSEVKRDIFKQKTVTCEGDLAFLGDSIQAPNTFVNITTVGNTKKKKKQKVEQNVTMTVENYFRSVIETHNNQMTDSKKQFTVGVVTISAKSTTEKFSNTSYSTTSNVISSKLLSEYGGVIRTRYENDVAYIDWLESYEYPTADGNRASVNSQKVRFGVNLESIDEDQPNDSIWTVLLPIGKDGITIYSVNNNSIYLENSTAVNKYGKIIHYKKFSDISKPADLLAKARKYLNLHAKVYPNDLTVKAVDLQLIGESDSPLELGDRINVVSSPHGINQTMQCVEIDIDIQNIENNSYTIGSVMPPDGQGVKAISSRQASSRRSSSTRANTVSDTLDSLGQDVRANSNNINVNAENIAVNAQHIAINAENIAVAAQNISIAAQTIDIKAQELTATFESESGDLSATITATATEIKSHMTDEVDDVASTITQTASSFTTSITNAKNFLSSKVEQTASSITTTFNQTLYGDDLTGNTSGVIYDYKSRIQASAQSLTSDYTKRMYGEGGTLANPTDGGLVADYHSRISQSATNIRSEVSVKLYGENGTDANPTGGIKSVINQNAYAITQRVQYGDVISSINQTAETIKIQASKIELSGYVTASQLSTTNANITKLTNGTTVASNIKATRIDARGSLYIGDSETNANLYYRGSAFSNCKLKMGSVLNFRYVLGSLVSGNATDIDLAHSHSVTVNNDGTITLGAVSSTGGSFRIADTKAYKDGVSAATNAVTVTDIVNRQSQSYNSTTHSTTLYLQAQASNGATYNEDFVVPGTDAYNAGVNSVTIWDIVNRQSSTYNSSTYTTTLYLQAQASNGATYNESFFVSGVNAYNDGVNSVTISDIINRQSSSYNSTTHATTLYLQAQASNGKTYNEDFVVPGTDAFNAGVNSVTVTDISDRADSYYNSSTHNTMLYLRATASNGNTYDENYIIYGGNAYDDGYDDGMNNVSIQNLSSGTPTLLSDRKTLEVTLSITLNNGTTDNSRYLNVDGSYAYDAGWSDGNSYGYSNGYSVGYSAGNGDVGPSDVTVTHVTVHSNGQSTVTVMRNGSYWNHSVDAANVQDNHS